MTTSTARTAEIANARKVDTEVARLWAEFYAVNDQIAPINKKISNLRKYTWYTAEQKAAQTADFEAHIAAIVAKATPLREAAQAYDAANYTGWTRFFLVKHIHNTTHCSSFRITTRIGWLPNVSGLTEVEAVKEHGETLCTICFPSAPTELTTKQADPAICTGTRNYSAASREGYYTGNWGTCSCGQRVTLTSTGNLRKHKA